MADDIKKKTLGETIGYPGSTPAQDDESERARKMAALKRLLTSGS
jgi:hypothetical protein